MIDTYIQNHISIATVGEEGDLVCVVALMCGEMLSEVFVARQEANLQSLGGETWT